jgi:hypothetical protein
MSRPRSGADTGNGDPCPLNPEHGKMYFLNGSTNQYCADQSHDGAPKSAPGGPQPMTRKVWPQGSDALRRAVITTTLPEIDVALLGG